MKHDKLFANQNVRKICIRMQMTINLWDRHWVKGHWNFYTEPSFPPKFQTAWIQLHLWNPWLKSPRSNLKFINIATYSIDNWHRQRVITIVYKLQNNYVQNIRGKHHVSSSKKWDLLASTTLGNKSQTSQGPYSTWILARAVDASTARCSNSTSLSMAACLLG